MPRSAVLVAVLALAGLGLARSSRAEEAEVEGGFRREAEYLDAGGEPLGARYVHAGTGFLVRLLRIDSVPQVFIHVGAPPKGDGGEPHTGEHLLLGKGSVGKRLAALYEACLVESTAYTDQTEVCYSFNCAAGPDTFQRVLERTLEALLFPDYSDAEVRREVCHLAAVEGADGQLALEEKGTVYNEMVSTYEKRWNVFYEVGKKVHGAGHPLSDSAGGSPEGLRALTAEQVHAFHAAHYRLDNMGLIAALPAAIPFEQFLARLGPALERLAARPGHAGRGEGAAEVPAPRPQRDRRLLVVPFPSESEEEAGILVMAWPHRAPADPAGTLLRRLLLEALGDGEASLLHRLLLDREKRALEVDASSVWGGLDETVVSQGASLGLSGFAPRQARERELRAIERLIRGEVDRLAAAEGDDPELRAFTARAEARLRDVERDLKRRLSQPPLFGRRGGGGFWISHLRALDRAGGARRSLVLADALARVRERLAAPGNPWTEVIDDLGLRDAPVIGVSVPSRAEKERRAAAKAARLQAALGRLQAEAGAADAQAALRGLRARLEAEDEAEAKRDADLPHEALTPDVPLALDAGLQAKEETWAGVPVYRAHFASMSALELNLSFGLETVTPEELPLLPLLPALVGGVGLRDAAGQRLAYDALQEQLEAEVGGIGARFDLLPERGRYEVQLTAGGVDLAEARRALHWLRRCLLEVDLSPENLPRLRDLVRQQGRELRAVLGRSEEGWVRNPAAALRWRQDALYLSAAAIHTRLHHLARLGWLLGEPAPAAQAAGWAAVQAWLAGEVERAGGAAALQALRDACAGQAPPEGLGALGGEAGAPLRAWLAPWVEDLAALQADLPPGPEGARDLLGLVRQLAADLAAPPARTLERLRRLFRVLRPASRTRLVLTGRAGDLDALRPDAEALLEALRKAEEGQAPRVAPKRPLPPDRLLARARSRAGEGAPTPVHFGLVNEAMTSGVFVFSARVTPDESAAEDDLQELLAASVDAGGGPHGFFMRTWAAGLAYSNGLRASPRWGRVSYYAERCPDLAETMGFVAGLAREAERTRDPALLEYALAQLVSDHRMAEPFPSRARAQAADDLDGFRPAALREQREALLRLGRDPARWEAVRARYVEAVGRVLVGVGAPLREAAEGTFLAIGPERLLAGWERYVRGCEGEGERVFRLYPADLWLDPLD